jgi:hypothetical protein
VGVSLILERGAHNEPQGLSVSPLPLDSLLRRLSRGAFRLVSLPRQDLQWEDETPAPQSIRW